LLYGIALLLLLVGLPRHVVSAASSSPTCWPTHCHHLLLLPLLPPGACIGQQRGPEALSQQPQVQSEGKLPELLSPRVLQLAGLVGPPLGWVSLRTQEALPHADESCCVAA
jgi:hypothetical protein